MKLLMCILYICFYTVHCQYHIYFIFYLSMHIGMNCLTINKQAINVCIKLSRINVYLNIFKRESKSFGSQFYTSSRFSHVSLNSLFLYYTACEEKCVHRTEHGGKIKRCPCCWFFKLGCKSYFVLKSRAAVCFS